jgi:hypothetical protein
MNISHIINEDLYNEIWKVVWSDCRQTVTKQTSPHMPIAIYHSIALNIDDDGLRGNIVLEINKTLMIKKL